MQLRTVKEADVRGKRVLVRVDFNVPVENGQVADDTRIREALPTIEYLLKEKAKVILLSHLGRPDGKKDGKFRLQPVFTALKRLLPQYSVSYFPHCADDPEAQHVVKNMNQGQAVLLENVRFCAGEETCDGGFMKKLASLADVFVNDAFGAAHRAHASTAGIAKLLPSYAGFLVEREVQNLSQLLGNPERPYVGIIGGAKISTKLGVIQSLLGKVDFLLLGGALANTILKAQGIQVGKSLIEEKMMTLAQKLALTDPKLKMPVDVVVAEERSEDVPCAVRAVANVGEAEIILDIGPDTIGLFRTIIEKARTIVWNGPMGIFEIDRFAHGTYAIADMIARTDAKSFAGGGETVDAIHERKLEKHFTFISSGGGAMLKFLEGKTLPGIKPLLK